MKNTSYVNRRKKISVSLTGLTKGEFKKLAGHKFTPSQLEAEWTKVEAMIKENKAAEKEAVKAEKEAKAAEKKEDAE